MIPARMGSQRLARKNLRILGGLPLITRAIRKCVASGVFDEIYVNSEDNKFAEIARQENVEFYKRPESLGNNTATSEQYILDFLQARECDYLIQVHSIAPLLSIREIRDFTGQMKQGKFDVGLSCELIQIECARSGKPINFSFQEKTNSQEIEPIQRISWSITGWHRKTFLDAVTHDKCATYAGRIGFISISRLAAHVVKTEIDLQIAEALLPLVGKDD